MILNKKQKYNFIADKRTLNSPIENQKRANKNQE